MAGRRKKTGPPTQTEASKRISPRVQALREILALRVLRLPVPPWLRELDDMRFTSRRRVHAVISRMRADGADWNEVEVNKYVEEEIPS